MRIFEIRPQLQEAKRSTYQLRQKMEDGSEVLHRGVSMTLAFGEEPAKNAWKIFKARHPWLLNSKLLFPVCLWDEVLELARLKNKELAERAKFCVKNDPCQQENDENVDDPVDDFSEKSADVWPLFGGDSWPQRDGDNEPLPDGDELSPLLDAENLAKLEGSIIFSGMVEKLDPKTPLRIIAQRWFQAREAHDDEIYSGLELFSKERHLLAFVSHILRACSTARISGTLTMLDVVPNFDPRDPLDHTHEALWKLGIRSRFVFAFLSFHWVYLCDLIARCEAVRQETRWYVVTGICQYKIDVCVPDDGDPLPWVHDALCYVMTGLVEPYHEFFLFYLELLPDETIYVREYEPISDDVSSVLKSDSQRQLDERLSSVLFFKAQQTREDGTET